MTAHIRDLAYLGNFIVGALALMIWASVAYVRRRQWRYTAAPLLWIGHVIVFLGHRLIFGGIEPENRYALWLAAIVFHGLASLIGIGYVWLIAPRRRT